MGNNVIFYHILKESSILRTQKSEAGGLPDRDEEELYSSHYWTQQGKDNPRQAIRELTPELVYTLIRRIEIHEQGKKDRSCEKHPGLIKKTLRGSFAFPESFFIIFALTHPSGPRPPYEGLAYAAAVLISQINPYLS